VRRIGTAVKVELSMTERSLRCSFAGFAAASSWYEQQVAGVGCDTPLLDACLSR